MTVDDITRTTEPVADEGQRPSNGGGQTAARTLVVNPYLRVVQCSRDEFLIKHGTRSPYSEVLRDDGRTGLLGRVLGTLTTPGSLQQLVQRGVLSVDELAAADELASTLLDRGILIDPSRTLAHTYLTTMLGNGKPVDVTALTTATIGIVGCGQLGSKIAEELGALQPAGMLLFDPRPAESGARDAVLRDRLASAEVITSERSDLADDGALGKLCQRSDFVVLAMETYSPTVLHALNENAINTRTRWLSVYFDGSEAVIGPTYVPGETCCYHEFETQAQASLRYKAEYLVFKEFLRDTAVDSEPLVLPPYASVAAGFAVTSVVRSLLNGQTFTVGRAMRINFETLSIDMQDVLRLPRCPACGGARPTYRNLFL